VKWEPTTAVHGSVIDKDDPFSAHFTPSTDQLVISDSETWIMINAAPLVFGRPNPDGISLATRVAGDGFDNGRGTFDEALEVVREMASKPGADLELLASVLRNVMDPIELMAFIASIEQAEC